MSKRAQVYDLAEDEKLDKFFASEHPLTQACAGIVRGAHIIEPFEPEMAADARKRFHHFSAETKKLVKTRNQKEFLNHLVELRNILSGIAAIIHHHKIDEVGITSDQLVDGFLYLAQNLEDWALPFGMIPVSGEVN